MVAATAMGQHLRGSQTDAASASSEIHMLQQETLYAQRKAAYSVAPQKGDCPLAYRLKTHLISLALVVFLPKVR